MLTLTQSSAFLIGDVAKLLGFIMNGLFIALDAIGIGNIGLAIILFTFIVKLLMMPLTIKQQKFTKLSNVMNPEIQAIQKKYKDKKDNDSMIKMNDETKAVYAKYGTSPTGGCVQMLIQMPILFALYKVIQSIPAYVPQIKAFFLNILGNNGVDGIMGAPDFADKMTNLFGNATDWTNTDKIIDTLSILSPDQWSQVKEAFPAFSDMITNNVDHINHMNNFLGVSMSQSPGWTLGIPILIPILAALTQYFSVKLSQGNMNMDEDNPTAASMKMMNMVMPVMSGLFAVTLPAGLGIYWIATAVFQIIMQLVVNKYFDKVGVQGIIDANLDKINKKRAKQGLPPEKVVNNAKIVTKNIDANQNKVKSLQEKKEANDRKVKEILESTNYYKSDKPGSLAEKANMVRKYDEKGTKKK